MKKFFFVLALFGSSFSSFANETFFRLGAYIDTYYTNDDDKNLYDVLGEHPRRKLSSINNLKDRFALNIAYLSLKVNNNDFRSTLGLQAGDIPDNIYFEEPKIIQQANIGVRLLGSLWLDGGYFTTPIGVETTHPRNNYLSTHSMVTYYQPTYHSGLKLSYQFNDNISAEAYLVNGNHLFKDNNEQKSFMWSLNYVTKKGDFTFSYNGIAGNEEKAEDKPKLHALHNFYVIAKVYKDLELKAQFDFATKEEAVEKKDDKLETAYYFGSFFQAKYNIMDKLNLSARISNFDDGDNLYLTNISGIDATLGLEYIPIEKAYIRLESRMLRLEEGKNQQGMIFYRDKKYSRERFEASLNFGFSFDLVKKIEN